MLSWGSPNTKKFKKKKQEREKNKNGKCRKKY